MALGGGLADSLIVDKSDCLCYYHLKVVINVMALYLISAFAQSTVAGPNLTSIFM